MPGFSFFATLLAGLGALPFRRTTTTWPGFVLAFGVLLVGVGLASDQDAALATGLFVGAVALGVFLGRMVPAEFGAMLVVLAVLAAMDILWISFGGGAGSGLLEDVGNLKLELGDTTSSIGTIDLVVAAGLTTHWLRRGTKTWIAIAPGPIGMVFSNLFVAATGASNLALVPFLLLGWLITEGLHRASAGLESKRANGPAG